MITTLTKMRLTLPHEILQVMPLDIVGQVTDIDPAVLLGRVADRLHHLLLCLSSLFETPGR